MERAFDITIYKDLYGDDDELFKEILLMWVTSAEEDIKLLQELKESKLYYVEYEKKLYYRMYRMIRDIQNAENPIDPNLIRAYTMLGYFMKANNLTEFKLIHRYLCHYIKYRYNYPGKTRKFNNVSVDKHRKYLIEGPKEKFYEFCKKLPNADISDFKWIYADGSVSTKAKYYNAILNDAYHISSELERIDFIKKYDQLSQQNIQEVIDFMTSAIVFLDGLLKHDTKKN